MTVRVFLAGDYHNRATPQFLDQDLRTLIAEHDLAVCNFEAPVHTLAAAPIPKAGPSLSQPERSPAWLAQGGFRLCTLANNHIFDYGQAGLKQTLDSMREAEVETFGAGLDYASAYRPVVKLIQGMRIGFIGACEAQFGVLGDRSQDGGGFAWIHHPDILHNLLQLRKETDFIIFVAHAGLEDTPLPLPEWRRCYRQLCDYGADVVVAHHPHVPQGWERYRESLIFYSLGNFFFDNCGYENKSNYSYSVSLTLNAGAPAHFGQIAHRRSDGRTSLVNDKAFDNYLDNLNVWLDERGGYARFVEQQVLRSFRELYRDYYARALLGGFSDQSLLRRMTNALRLVLAPAWKEAQRELLLLHNIRIESHRYTVEHALSLLHERGKPSTTKEFDAILLAMRRYS